MSKASKKSAYKMKPHSIAKVSLYKRYLSIYLNIIVRSPVRKIHLYDFFAGEGVDIDGNESSSIAGLNAIKEHYFSNDNCILPIDFYINDNGFSETQPELTKIERIKNLASDIFIPAQVNITYSQDTFDTVITSAIRQLSSLDNLERAFCFIDPWGYKEVKPQQLKSLLDNKKTEVLLFLPICFMHRFAKKALTDEDYKAGAHIDSFLRELYGDQIPDIAHQVRFIKDLKKKFKSYLDVTYIDEIFIEKEKGQYFALFFFSNNKRGFHKMLEAKWTLDEKEGKGFTVNPTSGGLFDDIDHEDYTHTVLDELRRKTGLTNQELFDFGLENNHLPKHTNKVLQRLAQENRISIISLDGKPVQGYYLDDNHERKIKIQFKQ